MKKSSALIFGACCLLVAGGFVLSKFSSGGTISNVPSSNVPISPRTTTAVPSPPATSEQIKVLPEMEVAQATTRFRATKHRKQTLKNLGLAPDHDLVGDYLSGKRDRGKFLRAKAYLLSLGYCDDRATWFAALDCFDPKWRDPDSEEWKIKWANDKKAEDEGARKYPPLSDKEIASIALDPNRSSLYSLLKPDQPQAGLEARIAALLASDKYLEPGADIASLIQLAPDSAWGPVLAAKAAIERGDWAEAEKWTRNFLDKKMEPAYLGLREQLTRFLMAERNYSYDEASRWMVEGLDSDSLARHSLDLAMAYHRQAKQMKAEGNPAWEALAANGLALAEAGTPIHWEDGLHYQASLLHLLGKDLAQKYLSEPYDQVDAEITQSIPQARAESLRVWELQRSLEPNQRLEFNFLLKTKGAAAALKQFSPK